MNAFVLDRSTVPPGGEFYYIQPETGARLTGISYSEWMYNIEQHRIANNLPQDFNWKLSIEQWFCYELKQKGIEWCQVRGVGDAVAYVVQPFAHAIDQKFGTNLIGCGGCKKRQRTLNNAFKK